MQFILKERIEMKKAIIFIIIMTELFMAIGLYQGNKNMEISSTDNTGVFTLEIMPMTSDPGTVPPR